MARIKSSSTSTPSGPPARDPDNREKQLIARAEALAERQILDGTASSQILTHYLKMGSTRERLEQERLRQENEHLKAKIEAMGSAKRIEEMYEEAMNAFRTYSGQDPVEYDYEP